MPKRICPVCNASIDPSAHGRRIYCSARCGAWAARHLNQRRCALPDCDRPHRARGLCGTHYRQAYQPDRQRRVETPCTVCGTTVLKHYMSGKRRPVCSNRCRYFLSWGKWPASKELVHVGPVVKTPRPGFADVATVESTKRGFVAGFCLWCAEPFVFDLRVGGWPPLTCSTRCAKRRNRWQQRGSKFQVPDAIRFGIYERDGWTCQLCMEPVEADAEPSTDWFPTLDHITPKSHGGGDEPENLRTAHHWCNAVLNDGRFYTVADLRAS